MFGFCDYIVQVVYFVNDGELARGYGEGSGAILASHSLGSANFTPCLEYIPLK